MKTLDEVVELAAAQNVRLRVNPKGANLLRA